MSRSSINPPAIVHEAESIAELIAEYQALETDIAQAERQTLKQAIRQGKILLKIREKCSHGEWYPALQKLGVPHQRATERMEIARLPEEILASCTCIKDAIDYSCGVDPSEKTKPPEPAISNKSENLDLSTVFCRPCRVGGAKPGCKECKALRASMAAGGKIEPAPDAAPAHAGDAWEAEDQPKPFFRGERIPFDWEPWRVAFDLMAAQVEILSEGTTAAEHLKRKLADFAKEFKAVQRKVYAQK